MIHPESCATCGAKTYLLIASHLLFSQRSVRAAARAERALGLGFSRLDAPGVRAGATSWLNTCAAVSERASRS